MQWAAFFIRPQAGQGQWGIWQDKYMLPSDACVSATVEVCLRLLTTLCAYQFMTPILSLTITAATYFRSGAPFVVGFFQRVSDQRHHDVCVLTCTCKV